jgi:hypothetical protein
MRNVYISCMSPGLNIEECNDLPTFLVYACITRPWYVLRRVSG